MKPKLPPWRTCDTPPHPSPYLNVSTSALNFMSLIHPLMTPHNPFTRLKLYFPSQKSLP